MSGGGRWNMLAVIVMEGKSGCIFWFFVCRWCIQMAATCNWRHFVSPLCLWSNGRLLAFKLNTQKGCGYICCGSWLGLKITPYFVSFKAPRIISRRVNRVRLRDVAVYLSLSVSRSCIRSVSLSLTECLTDFAVIEWFVCVLLSSFWLCFRPIPFLIAVGCVIPFHWCIMAMWWCMVLCAL